MVENQESFSVVHGTTASDSAETLHHPAAIEVAQGYFTAYQQEKLKKIYLPPHHHETTFATLVKRLAGHKSGNLEQDIAELITNGRFLPHPNLLKNKRPIEHMYVTVEDELNSIFDQLKELVVNFQNLVSTTINFSQLRPKMSLIKSTQGFSSGPVSFIKIYTSTLDTLRHNLVNELTPEQNFILNIHHPDILEYLIFIKNFQKNSLNKNTRFQIEITPQFWESLSHEEDFELINPKTSETVNLLSAKNTFDLIISTMLENPQLGLSRAPSTTSKNNLQISGLINLGAYTGNNLESSLPKDLKAAEDFLQRQSLPENNYPGWSKNICISFTGWADLLIRKNIAYDSISAMELAEKLFNQAKQTLSPNTRISINLRSPLLNILQTGHGLEALEQLANIKTNLEGQDVYQLNPLLKTILTQQNIASEQLAQTIFENNSISESPQVPTRLKLLFKTAQEIDHQFHLELQRKMEEILGGHVEKKIFFQNPLDQEKIKESLAEKLAQGLQNIAFLQLGILQQDNSEKENEISKNFLTTLNKNKKRRHREIQPPLFQIKKTEEITLPPIST